MTMGRLPSLQRHRFGARVGRNGLIAELHAMREAGVQHIGLHFRRNQRPLDDTLQEIAEFVLPQFHSSDSAETIPLGMQGRSPG